MKRDSGWIETGRVRYYCQTLLYSYNSGVKKQLKYIDLFSGCGGLSLGFYNSALWHGSFAVEKSKMAFDTLKYNLIDNNGHFDWPNEISCKEHEINELLETKEDYLRSLQGKVDLVAWWPPCQGFSTAWKRVEDDFRNSLVHSYINFVKLVQPKAIFFENVKWFTLEFQKNKAKWKNFSEEVKKQLEDVGEYWYDVHGEMLNFSHYGVPQARKRYILVWIRKDIADTKNITAKKFFIELGKDSSEILHKKWLSRSASILDAIWDLEQKSGIEKSPDGGSWFMHGKYWKSNTRLQEYLRGNVNTDLVDSHRFARHSDKTKDRFKRMIWASKTNSEIDDTTLTKKRNQIVLQGNEASPTLTTLPDDYLHYEEPRILTVREYARIQTFNDWFEIKWKYTTWGKQRKLETPRYTQMGNAIPPLFAEQAGIILHKLIS